jgi:hypothetical protein
MDIKITDGIVINWEHDEAFNEIPSTYTLKFKFHDEYFKAVFTTTELKAAQDGEPLYYGYAETYSDFLDSFNSKLEDEDVAKEVLEYCKKIWEKAISNVGVYNFIGEKI